MKKRKAQSYLSGDGPWALEYTVPDVLIYDSHVRAFRAHERLAKTRRTFRLMLTQWRIGDERRKVQSRCWPRLIR